MLLNNKKLSNKIYFNYICINIFSFPFNKKNFYWYIFSLNHFFQYMYHFFVILDSVMSLSFCNINFKRKFIYRIKNFNCKEKFMKFQLLCKKIQESIKELILIFLLQYIYVHILYLALIFFIIFIKYMIFLSIQNK